MPDAPGFRRRLLGWYRQHARNLPWRSTTDPWKILVSEIMLQQTRVETVLPYYQRFLARFPTAPALSAAPEPDVLALWSGLGYYSRARNLQRAARLVPNGIPPDFDRIRALPGIGPYTAAAVASIAFGLPHAAIDGNVLRVMARLTGDAGDIAAGATRQRITEAAQHLLDPQHPGDFNQAMMELGATLCVPRAPRCLVCPVAQDCVALREGRQTELPIKRPKPAPTAVEVSVVIVRRRDRLLLRRRPPSAARMPGFWELPSPEDVPQVPILRDAGAFRHTIVNTRFQIRVQIAAPFRLAHLKNASAGLLWFPPSEIASMPITTITRKALACLAEG